MREDLASQLDALPAEVVEELDGNKIDLDCLTAKTILEDDVFDYLLGIEDEVAQTRLELDLIDRAVELGKKREFSRLLAAHKKSEDRRLKRYKQVNAIIGSPVCLKFDGKGVPCQTIENFSLILDNDRTLKENFLFNELGGIPEKMVDGVPTRWVDEDDASMRRYIEQKYNLYNKDKLEDALRIKFAQNKYHPIREMIQSITWDQKPRIETLLIKYLGVEDSAYSREVSRLIFAGGINRAFNPGCKFDDMPVLIGKRQGEGKSTFVRWLAMDDKYYREVTEIDGQRGIESIEGAWICEMGELLALKRTKDVEAVKSYVSRLVDTYRQPFDKRVTDHKRQCIFIGTTNNVEFLTDKTGNRRYYPVVCNNSGRDLFDNEKQIKDDIAQCWAEAYWRYFHNEDMQPVAKRELIQEIKQRQSESVEDDYRVGLIQAYLEDKDTVCVLELWKRALGESFKPAKRDSNEISLIMQGFPEWEKSKKSERTEEYGVQKVWHKKTSIDNSIDFSQFEYID